MWIVEVHLLHTIPVRAHQRDRDFRPVSSFGIPDKFRQVLFLSDDKE